LFSPRTPRKSWPLTAASLFSNKTSLVQSLIKERVVSSGATFDSFALAFNSSPNCNMTDIGQRAPSSRPSAHNSTVLTFGSTCTGATPVEEKMASLLKIHVPTKWDDVSLMLDLRERDAHFPFAFRSLKRVYIVGIHPTSLLSIAPQLVIAEKTPLSRSFEAKVVA
jgi:hypothetical protein